MYNENTLSVRFDGSYDSWEGYCSIFHTGTDVMYRSTYYSPLAITLKHIAKAENVEASRRMCQMYPVFLKIQNLEITMEFNDQEEIFAACQILERLVQGKNVSVIFDRP